MEYAAQLDLVRSVGRTIRRGPYRVHVVRDPGLVWDDDEQRLLMEMVRGAALRMFDDPTVGEYWDGRPDYLKKIDEWWVAEHDDALAGWSACAILDGPTGPMIYMDTLGVLPEHRRSHLGAVLGQEPWFWLWRRRRRVPVLTLRTESPIIFRLVRRLGGRRHTYPRLAPDGTPEVTERVVACARFTSQRLTGDKPMNAETLVVPGALEVGSLYGSEPPPCGAPDVDAYFRAHLDLPGGDSVIMVVDNRLGLPAFMNATHWPVRATLRRKGLNAAAPR